MSDNHNKALSPKVLLVTGMHRSGTSALMGVCNILGVKVLSNLYPADAMNPKGYWEPKYIVDTHDMLLSDLGRSWNDSRPLPSEWIESTVVRRYGVKIIEILKRDVAGFPVWGVKDPRICRLLPMWIKIIKATGGTPYILQIFRDPDEVAQSLRKRESIFQDSDNVDVLRRERFPIDDPYALWSRYVLDAERDSRSYNRAFISYDDLLADWYDTLTQAAERLKFEWPVAPDTVKNKVDAFLSQKLRHQHADMISEKDQTETANTARAIFQALKSASAGDERKLVEFSEKAAIPKKPTKSFKLAAKMGEFEDPEQVRAIAFYLPQYHPIPENDAWWGKGFTDWNNVVSAQPRFAEHYQPHLPADLGFYDLRLPEVREAQASLARKYEISGFCYYHYWFGGKRLLERPFEEVLNSGEPDFPFCLCWANENWTRGWDGKDREVLISQQHSSEDDIALIRNVMPAFRDPRYIRLHGRPLFLVYRAGILPDPRGTVNRWRNECLAAGIGNPIFCVMQSFDVVDPRPFGFDAAVEFPPHNYWINKYCYPPFLGILNSYGKVIEEFLEKDVPEYTWFRGVMPSWDNSARRKELEFQTFLGSDPAYYLFWLRNAVKWSRNHNLPGERLVFINAWNEWGEGCHLEPDIRYGHSWLEATRAAMQSIQI